MWGIFQSDDTVVESFCLRDSSGFAYSRFAPSASFAQVSIRHLWLFNHRFGISSQQVRLINIHCMGEREQSQGGIKVE